VDYVENTWLPFVERSKKPSTYAGYRSYWLRYIKPRVERYVLRDFTVAVVSTLLEDAAVHNLNVDTVGKICGILSAVFTFAMGKGHSRQISRGKPRTPRESAGDENLTLNATSDELRNSINIKQGETCGEDEPKHAMMK
jgi:hypothetical protein